MKCINIKSLITIITVVVTFSLFVTSAHANDGITPAEETTCDGLKTDGVTKGLYGLCVAYCEAQDVFDETVPVTKEEELAIIEANMPSEKILANYHKRMKDTDPEMPCIVRVPDAECPCWDNLDSFDGVDDVSVGDIATLSCSSKFSEDELRESVSNRGFKYAKSITALGAYRCDSRIVGRKALRIDAVEYEACKAQIKAVCDTYGL
ncbi:MAG: hypothetical protein V7720_15245 [Halioglobus sp.]